MGASPRALSAWLRVAACVFALLASSTAAAEADPPPASSDAAEEEKQADREPPPGSVREIFGRAEDEGVPWYDQGSTPRTVVEGKFALADFLTGPWFGLREELYEHGFDLRGDYVNEPMGNPKGGNRQGFTYTHNLGLELLVSLDRVVGWPGAAFRVKYSQRSGNNLSDKKVGNTWQIQQIYGGQNHKLVNVHLIQSLWEDRVNLSIGRIVYNDEFQKSPLNCQFLNNAFCGIPIGIYRNIPDGATTYPWSTWGARIRVRPTTESYVMAAVYDGDPTQRGENDNGTNWDWGHNKALITWEGGWVPERGLLGLPAAYKFGGWFHTGEFDDLSEDENGDNRFVTGLPARERDGAVGLYVAFDQTLYRKRPGGPEELIAFANFNFAPQEKRSELPFFYVAGLSYTGLIPGRPHDQAVFGIAHGIYQDELKKAQRKAGIRAQRREIVLEWNYQINFTPFIYLRPDMQYIIDPGGVDEIDDALAMGFEFGVRF